MIQRDGAEDVLLAFCHNGGVASCFMVSVFAAFTHDMQIGYGHPPRRRLADFHHAQSPYIHGGRSRIAEALLEEPALKNIQWLWFVDNDMEFPPDTLNRMLATAEHFDTKVLGAAYWNQYPGTRTYLSWLMFTPEGIHPIQELPPGVTDPMPVTAVGMGCTLIHRTVLQDVADMYPNDPWATFGADILLHFEEGGYLVGSKLEDFQQALASTHEGKTIKSIDRMGEDVTFCIRAARAGYLTYGMPTLTVEHFKPHRMAHGEQAPLFSQPSPDGVRLSP